MESSYAPSVSCARCRTRRVKCDRRTGGCLRCEKLSEPCPGYSRVRRFLDEGPSLRNKFSKTQSPQGRDYEPNQPLSSSTRHDQPPPPAEVSPSGPDPLDTQAGSHGVDIVGFDVGSASFSEAQSQESAFDDAYFDLDPDTYYAQENNSCGFAPHIPLTPGALEQVAQPPTSSDSPQSFVQVSCEAAEELAALDQGPENFPELDLHEALLTRHFVDEISPWLDVFDSDKYFGHTVPVSSLRSRLLRDTILAIAARQLGNKGRELAFTGGGTFTGLETGGHGLRVDWSYEAAGFYDRAIRQMVSSLQYIGTGERSATENGGERDKVDNMLSAVSIFLLYESLDDRHLSISQHMAGAQHLLQLVLGQQQPPASVDVLDAGPSSGVGTTKAWRASFWNLASFDYINSYARLDNPRLEFNDVRLWEASGLPMTRIDEQHIPRSLIRNHDFKERMSEKMACRTLIWVVLKTLYFVFLNDQDSAGCVGNGVYHGHTESFHWHQIDQHLNDWYGALPNTFETCLRISNPSQRSIDPMPQPPSPFATAPTATIPFPQLFYTSSMGATALLLYHFTRILVLLNKPPDDPRRQTGVGRLQWHRRFSQQINHHAEEICGIAIGRPQPGVQIHLVQPLYLAGLCLDSDERKVVLADLLVGVQRRTGYSTEWRVIKLKEEWGWVDNP